MTDDERETVRQRAVANSPFGIHEALHTCSVLMDTFGVRVAEHPAVALRPNILAKAEQAIERMMDVYQALGRLPEWHVDFAADALAQGIEARQGGDVPGSYGSLANATIGGTAPSSDESPVAKPCAQRLYPPPRNEV
jgi:hypothetical protein